MIRFDTISKRYPGGFEALNRISFHLPRGKLAYLTELCENHDLAGVELDWLRDQHIFPRGLPLAEKLVGRPEVLVDHRIEPAARPERVEGGHEVRRPRGGNRFRLRGI